MDNKAYDNKKESTLLRLLFYDPDSDWIPILILYLSALGLAIGLCRPLAGEEGLLELVFVLGYFLVLCLALATIVMSVVAITFLLYDRPGSLPLTIFRRLFRFTFFELIFLFIFIYLLHLFNFEDYLKNKYLFPYDPAVVESLNKELKQLNFPDHGIEVSDLSISTELRSAPLVFIDENNTVICYENIPPERRPLQLKDARYLVRFSERPAESPYGEKVYIRKSLRGSEVLGRIPLYGIIHRVEILDQKKNILVYYEEHTVPEASHELFVREIVKKHMGIVLEGEKYLPFPEFEVMVIGSFKEVLTGNFSSIIEALKY